MMEIQQNNDFHGTAKSRKLISGHPQLFRCNMSKESLAIREFEKKDF